MRVANPAMATPKFGAGIKDKDYVNKKQGRSPLAQNDEYLMPPNPVSNKLLPHTLYVDDVLQ